MDINRDSMVELCGILDPDEISLYLLVKTLEEAGEKLTERRLISLSSKFTVTLKKLKQSGILPYGNGNLKQLEDAIRQMKAGLLVKKKKDISVENTPDGIRAKLIAYKLKERINHYTNGKFIFLDGWYQRQIFSAVGLLRAGATVEAITECMEAMFRDPFWAQQATSMESVKKYFPKFQMTVNRNLPVDQIKKVSGHDEVWDNGGIETEEPAAVVNHE